MSSIKIIASKSGDITAEIISNGKNLRLHSAFDPVKEAFRSVSSFTSSKNRLIIIAGLGLGYHIKAIKEKYPNNAILIIEKNQEMIDLCHKHCSDNVKNIRIITNPDDAASALEKLDMASFKGTSVFFHRQSYGLDKDFYDMIITDMSRYLTSKISDLLTRFEFEQKWAENILLNTSQLADSFPASLLFDRFKGIPGIIVSAGPSLIKSIDSLKKYKDHALIVAVDTAYKVLLKHDIEPHIVMVLDAQKQSQLHFFGANPGKTVLIADIVSSPAVIRNFKNHKFISTTAKYYDDSGGKLKREATPFVDWLEKYIEPLGDIQSGGSVATSVFDFLLNSGCSSIILVGQDLAYTGRKIHSNGTHHNEKWISLINRFNGLENINQAIIRKRKIKYVDSIIKEEKIITDFVLDLYLSWFSDSAKKIKIPVYNATAIGANIPGTIITTLDEFFIGKKSNKSDASEIIETITRRSQKFKIEKLKEAFSSTIKALEETAELLSNKSINADAVLDNMEKNDLDVVYRPFMKKTLTYLKRNTLTDLKQNQMLLDELSHVTKKVTVLFQQGLDRLN
ncbi:MAG TPA: DUF115 domain-containing protein [Spirochaetota bacterium]|nr:DUF115 domain-containing protein [Spirochaetota bacterium]